MEITLRPLTEKNYKECFKLEVHKEQSHMVAPNVYSVAESKIYPELSPLTIYSGETMVGFILHGTGEGRYWLVRLMIDKQHQKKGYGREALRLLIERLKEEREYESLYLSYTPDNTAAAAMYEKFGFVTTGEIVEDEIVVKLDL